MAIEGTGQGFFSSAGALKNETTAKPTTTTNTSTSDIQQSVANDTATQITEAAVVKISNQLNVGNTGYDSGVSELVQGAVTAGLQKQSVDQSSTTTPRKIGGTYQNEIMAKASSASTTTAPTPTPTASSSSTSGNSSSSPSSQTNGNGNSHRSERTNRHHESNDDSKSAKTSNSEHSKKADRVSSDGSTQGARHRSGKSSVG